MKKRIKKRKKRVGATNRPVAPALRGERITLRIAPAIQEIVRNAARNAGVTATEFHIRWLYRGLISENPDLRDLRACKACGKAFPDPGGDAEECPFCGSRRLRWLLKVGKERPAEVGVYEIDD